MSPPTITPHIPQSPNVLPHLPPQIILNLHRGQLGRELEDFRGGKGGEARGGVDEEFGEDGGGGGGAEAVEGLEGFFDEGGFGEGDAEDEDLVWGEGIRWGYVESWGRGGTMVDYQGGRSCKGG